MMSLRSRRDSWLWPFGVFVAAALLRGVALGGLGAEFDQDPDAYANLARGVREFGVIGFVNVDKPVRPTALRPPLYSLILAPLVVDGRPFPLGVAVLHVALGAATVVVVERLAAAWGLGRAGSLFAAGLLVCDPLLLNQSTLMMSETLAVFMSAASLLALTWWKSAPSSFRALLAGLVLGLAVLCRPTFAPWAGLCLATLLMSAAWRHRLGWAVVGMLGMAVLVAPWAVRNQIYLGRPVVTTTHGGYTLLLGNNPHFYDFITSPRREGRWDARELREGYRAQAYQTASFAESPSLEVQRDRLDSRLAWATIQQFPGKFAFAATVRLSRLWSPLPLQRSSSESKARMLMRYATALWYVAVFAAALLGTFVIGRDGIRLPWLWCFGLLATFSTVHLFYWCDLRMRAPLMPVVCILAAKGATWVWNCLKNRRLTSPQVMTEGDVET